MNGRFVLRASCALLALAAATSMFAAPRAAEACSYPARIEAVRPRLGERDVPTNAKIWIRGPLDAVVTLSANGAIIETDVGVLPAVPSAQAVTPRAALLPGVEYTVTASSAHVPAPLTWTFTTGAGPQMQPPAPPLGLEVTAEFTGKRAENSCDTTIGPFAVTVQSPPVAGAVLYQLETRYGGAIDFTVQGLALDPHFLLSAAELPTPTYRIRPIAANGEVVATASLPQKSAGSPGSPGSPGGDGEDDSAGCSTGRGVSGAGGAAGLLVALAMMAGRRRRR